MICWDHPSFISQEQFPSQILYSLTVFVQIYDVQEKLEACFSRGEPGPATDLVVCSTWEVGWHAYSWPRVLLF